MATLDLSLLLQTADLTSADSVSFDAFVASASNLWRWTTPNTDRRKSIEDARAVVAFYAGVAQYEPFFAAHGYAEVCKKLQHGVQQGSYKSVTHLVPDEMAQRFVLAGTPDEVAIQEEITTYKGVHRIIRYAFAYAATHNLTKVCMADKSNAMQQGHALWHLLTALAGGLLVAHYGRTASGHQNAPGANAGGETELPRVVGQT